MLGKVEFQAILLTSCKYQRRICNAQDLLTFLVSDQALVVDNKSVKETEYHNHTKRNKDNNLHDQATVKSPSFLP